MLHRTALGIWILREKVKGRELLCSRAYRELNGKAVIWCKILFVSWFLDYYHRFPLTMISHFNAFSSQVTLNLVEAE